MKRFLPWQQQNKVPGSSGFTLIELLIVIALVTLLTGLTLSVSTIFNRFLIKAELERLCAACRYVQHVALLKGKEQKIVIHPEQQSYSFFSTTYKLPRAVQFGVIAQAMGPPSKPDKPLASPVTFPNNSIVFYPDGVVSAGTVYLTDAHKKYLFALTSPISHVSYLRKYSYQNRWKQLS